MEHFVIIVTIITKRSILDVAAPYNVTIIKKSSILDVPAALDPPLVIVFQLRWLQELSLKNVPQKKINIRWISIGQLKSSS